MRIAKDPARHRVNRHARQPVAPRGTPLQRTLWRELRDILPRGISINDTQARHSLHLAGLIEWRDGWYLTERGRETLRTGRHA